MNNLSTGYVGTVTISTIDINNEVTVLASGVSPSSTTAYAVPSTAVRIRVASDDGGYLQPGKRFSFTVSTVFKDIESTTTSSKNLSNSAQFSYRFEGASTSGTVSTLAYIVYQPIDPKIQLTKSCTYTSRLSGTEQLYSIALLNPYSNGIPTDMTLDGQMLVDLLPQGVVYIPGSASVYSYTTGVTYFTSNEPQVIENYKGTGRTALAWTYKNSITGKGLGAYVYYMTISFRATVTKITEPGTAMNDVYLIWENNGSQSSGSTINATSSQSDVLDIDGDGNTTEQIAKASSSFTYVPPKELYSAKLVQGSLDAAATYTTGHTLVGGTANYTLKVNNRTDYPVSQLYIIDVLPYPGDQALTPYAVNAYRDRNSQFAVALTGSITGSAEYTVYYTTTVRGSNADLATFDAAATWTTTPTDFAAVKAVKIVLNSGSQLSANSSVTFNMPVSVPDEPSIVEQVAVNSVAISTNGTSYAESDPVSLTVISYTLSGAAFIDKDNNGYKDTDDETIPNTVVTLLDSSGNAVLDKSGNPITTTTDSSGAYSFSIYTPGTCSVSFSPPDGVYFEANTPPATDTSSTNRNNLIAGETYTSAVTFGSLTANSAILNAGYVRIADSITFTKTDASGNPLEGAEFTLYDADGNAVATASSDENGVVAFESVPYGSYTIEETEAPTEYVLSTATLSASIEKAGQKVILSKVVNQKIKQNQPGNNGPNTGDIGIAVYMLPLFLSALFIILLTVRKRKHSKKSA